MKQENPRAYRQEYLGIPAGLGDSVFDNIAAEPIKDREIRRFDPHYGRGGLGILSRSMGI